MTRAQGFADRNPGVGDLDRAADAEAADGEFERNPLGSFVPIRDVIEDELEQVFNGKRFAKVALDLASERKPFASPVRAGQSRQVR